MMNSSPAIWFPTIRAGTGTDVFTERLVSALQQRGLRAEITWLPLRAEYAPWTVAIPNSPPWANIVHVNTWLHTRFLPRHLPIVATIHHAVHHPDTQAYKGMLRSAYHRWWIAPNERLVLRRAARVVAVSEFVADSARQTLADVPMRVIYNGVDTCTFCPTAVPRPGSKPFRLLYVGSWMARKGVDLLPAIMGELGEDFELHYTGGPAAEKDKPQMPPNMYDIGRLQGDAAVVAAMQQADALLFPSRSEGHPLVAIEAMACGLPVVGMHGSSVAEAVTDGVNGLLCARDDVAALVAAVRVLAGDSMRLACMRIAARERVEEGFSLTSVTDSHVQLFSQLIREAEARHDPG